MLQQDKQDKLQKVTYQTHNILLKIHLHQYR